jgi:hypothetical protein
LLSGRPRGYDVGVMYTSRSPGSGRALRFSETPSAPLALR